MIVIITLSLSFKLSFCLSLFSSCIIIIIIINIIIQYNQSSSMMTQPMEHQNGFLLYTHTLKEDVQYTHSVIIIIIHGIKREEGRKEKRSCCHTGKEEIRDQSNYTRPTRAYHLMASIHPYGCWLQHHTTSFVHHPRRDLELRIQLCSGLDSLLVPTSSSPPHKKKEVKEKTCQPITSSKHKTFFSFSRSYRSSWSCWQPSGCAVEKSFHTHTHTLIYINTHKSRANWILQAHK